MSDRYFRASVLLKKQETLETLRSRRTQREDQRDGFEFRFLSANSAYSAFQSSLEATPFMTLDH